MKWTFALLTVLALAGCASSNKEPRIADHHGHIKAGDSSKISIGMTKLQVLQTLGRPEATSADAGGETLTYDLERPWWQDRPYKVVLKDDKVVSYGVIEKDNKSSPQAY